MTRSVTFEPEADHFVENCALMAASLGMGPGAIDNFIGHVCAVIFVQLPAGSLPVLAHYVGKDPDRDGYSMYVFSTDALYVTYTCNPIHVHVTEILSLFDPGEEAMWMAA